MSVAVPPPVLRAAPAERSARRTLSRWNSNLTGGLQENRYSRRVALLKRVLPVVGLALLLLITLWPRLAPLWERIRLNFAAIDLRDARELRMLNPRYAGTDRLDRPYLVTAASGRQIPNRQDLMSLEAPRADMKTHGGADVVITSKTGVYQSQVQLLDLFGEVNLVHENGTRFITNSARLDIAHNAAHGDDPIEGHGPSGDISAQGFRVFDKGDTILFTGRSDMLMRGAKTTSANAQQPPSLPPDVVATAARVEAQAKPILAAAPPHPVTPQKAAAHPAAAKKPSAPAKPSSGGEAQRAAAKAPAAKPAGQGKN
jgi:lipopolysaccharide export system protein LptC